MTDPRSTNATSVQQDNPSDAPAAATPAGTAGSAEKPAGHSTVPTRLREKGAAATEKVHARVTHAREAASQKAPAVKDALRDRRTAATEKVHAGVTHAREIASDKAPAVKGAVQERRGLAIGLTSAVTVVGYLLLRRLRGRKRRTHDSAETS
ncbi:hypothetical protein BJF90_18180 [Pseudonocardia sp. CNS-004]|nr:hypothetical protein BJF90_18180 [Pseudonocardia sp. CNS-004]